MDTKEKINGFFAKLPFKGLAEKIPPETRAKIPALDKAIPFANQIACGLIVVLAVAVITCSGGKSGGGKAAPASDFIYELNSAGDGVVITGYQEEAAGGDLVIPATIEGYPVVAVNFEDSGLAGLSRQFDETLAYFEGFSRMLTDKEVKAKGLRPYVTSIVFPDSITEIRGVKMGAKVKSVTFPKNLKMIPQGFAGNASNLTVVKWPEKLEEIGDMKDNERNFSRGGAFAGAGFTELVIPEGVKVIGEAAFNGCKNLTSVTLPESIETIGERAFADCPQLTTVKLPAKAINYPGQKKDYELSSGAFRNNPKLTGIAVRKAIQDTGYKADF